MLITKLRKGLLLSLSEFFFKSVNIWQNYKQERDYLVHVLRLLELWWPGAQSARDNNVLSCKFANYLPIKFFFTDLSNKLFLARLLTPPPRFEYVATLPYNLSLIARFMALMFHKVVWQRMQGMVGLLITSLLQIYQGIVQ